MQAQLAFLEGDENSAFFHKICNARKRRNFIFNIHNSIGEDCNTNVSIEAVFIDHFHKDFSKTSQISWLIDNLSWSPIYGPEKDQLCSPFLENEVSLTLKSFGSNKAPGPEGYTM